MPNLCGTLVAAVGAIGLCSHALGGGPPAFGGVIPDAEPSNNTLVSAQPIPMTGYATKIGILTLTPEDVDIVKVFMLSGNVLTAVTTPLDGPLNVPFLAPDTIITVTDSLGGFLTANDDAGSDYPTNGLTRGSVVRYQATANGYVGVQVTGYDEAGAGHYLLMISLTGASASGISEPESTETPAQAMALGMPLSGPISGEFSFVSGADVDYMSVDMRVGDVLTATSTPLNGPDFDNPDTLMSLFDSDGVTFVFESDDDHENDQDGTLGSTIRFRANHTGRVFLRMRSFDGDSQGAYEMTMCVTPRTLSVCTADLNADGVVNSGDLALVLGMWGVCH